MLNGHLIIDSSFWSADFIMEGDDFASKYLILNNVINNSSSGVDTERNMG